MQVFPALEELFSIEARHQQAQEMNNSMGEPNPSRPSVHIVKYAIHTSQIQITGIQHPLVLRDWSISGLLEELSGRRGRLQGLGDDEAMLS